ncbi:peroxisome biogenesis protein 5 [Gossypium hirsutum]|uniref:Peroxisome biogenesis protein 5 n=1 Tax=Gossypium hirsutum TaxID=3635 RepID=A0ABM2ZHD4_GOSHI|nr:peroxisome biogenesis protein 5-like [Gossypium hirsutum]
MILRVFRGPDHWANEFGAERLQQESVDDQWVNEFSKVHVDDWAEEFGRQVGEGALGDSSSDNWANSYDEGVYVFSDMNPYVGHQNPLKEGQELFRKGLLSEAVLALEAEVMKNPENAEGWRLLGITHAENDDDQQVFRRPDHWANEFGAVRLQQESVDDQWVPQRSDASRGVYIFSDMNPYVGHQNPLKEGQELFRKGLLREAVLALEAEVMKNPENAEGWRLLGITHAENDDDQQAIAAMMRAQEADPTNLEVLLALGVSHTNG